LPAWKRRGGPDYASSSRRGGNHEQGRILVLAIVHVPIDDLKPTGNPPHLDAELKPSTRSIREFGLNRPIIARKEDRTVIGGHQRLLVPAAGLKSVPFLDITKEKASLLNVALNRISGSFDRNCWPG